MKPGDLLTLDHLGSEEVRSLVNKVLQVKRSWGLLSGSGLLRGKAVMLFFELPSTRTRISFEVAAAKLGAYPIYVKAADLQLLRGETLADTARVVSSYVDLVVARVSSHGFLEEFARYSRVPVVNALTRMYHPTQAIADLATILELKGRLHGIKVAYVGDGFNNVCHSLMIACCKTGVDIVVGSPKGYEPDKDVVRRCMKYASRSGGSLTVVNSPEKAVEDADVVYTDVFVSMGVENERERRLRDFSGWQVDRRLVSRAKPDYIFMHCLPAHRGEEVAAEVMDDEEHSAVWVQAENKLYTAAAVLLKMLGQVSPG